MKYELIESLLIDKELGYLSDQSKQMLNQYTSETHNLNELQNEIHTICTLSKNAVMPKAILEIPDFPHHKLTNIKQIHSPYKAFIIRIFSVAALIIIGFILGTYLQTGQGTKTTLITNNNSSLNNTSIKTKNAALIPNNYFDNLKKLRVDRKNTSLKKSYQKIYDKYLNTKEHLIKL